MPRSSLSPILLLLAACVGPSPTEEDSGKTTPTPRWYLTCGDPVCEGYSGPFEGVPACTDEVLEAPCDVEGATCDPQNDCNARMICATEDPTQATGGCPISRKKYKTDIHYLDEGERGAAAEALLSTRLATWRYRWDDPSRPSRLGFLIDDQEESPAVAADREHVDLYGYTSLAVAALQAEHARVAALTARLDAQAEEIAALKEDLARLSATSSAPPAASPVPPVASPVQRSTSPASPPPARQPAAPEEAGVDRARDGTAE